MLFSEPSGTKSRRTDCGPPVRVVIFYEDRATGLLAAQTLDRIAARLTPDYTVQRSLWRLDVLVLGEVRHEAIEEARAADVVLVAVHGHCGALEETQAWLEACAVNGTGQPASLATLVVRSPGDAEASTALREWLAQLAARSGRSFLVAEVGLDWAEDSLVRGGTCQRERQTTEVLANWLRQAAGSPRARAGHRA